ncbi:MAG TPA: hypothetical protein VH561_14040 [Micromonosporaceae bacterium]|jgi:hypothetical protein
MSLSDVDVERARYQLAREEYNRRMAAIQSKPSFLGWLGRVGLEVIVAKIVAWLWGAIKAAFGLAAAV